MLVNYTHTIRLDFLFVISNAFRMLEMRSKSYWRNLCTQLDFLAGRTQSLSKNAEKYKKIIKKWKSNGIKWDQMEKNYNSK